MPAMLPLDQRLDPAKSARRAGLRYVSDAAPGLRRIRAGRGFRYETTAGRTVRAAHVLHRIRALAIPPAWTDVWICSQANGHLQAVGRDARGRKQYRYHPDWRSVRDETKYQRMIAFGLALPRIRARTQRHLRLPGLPREKVLALIVRLLETTLIRVGNEEYAKSNDSFGLTTMRDKHARVHGPTLAFEFTGKGGIRHRVEINNRRLARNVRRCQDLPGYELFQYVDDGRRHSVKSEDVNDYLRAISRADFTAKDFRTWAGTVLAARALQEFKSFDSQTEAKRNVVAAIETVSKRLGNTRSICRKCYVHPAVIDAYLDGTLVETLSKRAEKELRGALSRLPAEEAAVLTLLCQQLRRAAQA